MYLEIKNHTNKASQPNSSLSNSILQRKYARGEQQSDFLAAKIRAPDYFDSTESSNGEFSLPFTGPLPYKQATELADCIRIMGQANSAHCRSVVLGEETVPQENTSPPTVANPQTSTQASAPVSNCNPTAMTRTQYLAEPGTSLGDFGLTILRGRNVTMPIVQTTRTRRGRVILPTSASLPQLSSVFTGAGRFVEGTAIFASQGGGCRSGRYPVRWTITRSGAQKIRQGEQEHCDDFNHAFNISLNRFASAVNTVAQSGRTFRNQRHAERHIERMVGKAPADWSNFFQCLATKTLLRDGHRGSRGSHTPIAQRHPPTFRRNCQFAEAVISARSLRQVGQRSSSQLITGC